MTREEYNQRFEKLKEQIIKAMFIDKKFLITEVTFTYAGDYFVNGITRQDIIKAVNVINDTEIYKPIYTSYNSFGVLTLT